MNGRTLPTGSGGACRVGPRGVAASRPLLLRVALALGAVVVWLWLAADSRLHWDEPAYLYTAVHLTVPEILAGDFQPSGIQGFSVSRVGHVLLLKLIVTLLGPGALSLAVISACYLLMLAALLWTTYLILRTLVPGVPNPGPAVALCAFTPIYVYLAFKTVPEIPALLLASLAVLGLLRSLKARPLLWLTVAALALAGVASTKNNMALLYVSFVAALILCRGFGHPPGRVVAHAVVSGLGSLAIFSALLWAAGIALDRYLAVIVNLAAYNDPIAARLLMLALAAGPFLLALPLAFLSPRKAEARFFAVWFGLATLPVLFSGRVEERYLAVNFVALAGLVHLSMAGLGPLVRRWWAERPQVTSAAATLGGMALIVSTALAQPIMLHEVRMDQLRTVVRHLDATYGREGYAILTPWEYTDFHYLRFVHPERPVYTVFTPKLDPQVPEVWAEFQKRHYGPRAVHTVDGLAALGSELVYLGFEESLPVANMRRLIATALPPLQRFVDELASKMTTQRHLAQSWMWGHPRIKLSEGFRHGHYVALRVEIIPAPDPTASTGSVAGPSCLLPAAGPPVPLAVPPGPMSRLKVEAFCGAWPFSSLSK